MIIIVMFVVGFCIGYLIKKRIDDIEENNKSRLLLKNKKCPYCGKK